MENFMKSHRSKATVAVVIMGLSGLLLSSCAPADTNESLPTSSPAMTPEPTTTEQARPVAGSYLGFSEYEASAASYSGTNVVLFFNASWCSTCKVARDNFEASLSEIPGDMTLVVVDFDDSESLRIKYGVTIQHTFVQIDDNGELLKKWSGSATIPELIEQTA
jgi:thiol-disulfide isomerase/thioredoxin